MKLFPAKRLIRDLKRTGYAVDKSKTRGAGTTDARHSEWVVIREGLVCAEIQKYELFGDPNTKIYGTPWAGEIELIAKNYGPNDKLDETGKTYYAKSTLLHGGTVNLGR